LTTPRLPGSLTPTDVRIQSFNTEQWSDLWPEMKDMLNTILQPGASPGQSPSSTSPAVLTPNVGQESEKVPSEVPTISTPTDLTSVVAEDKLREIVPSSVAEPEISQLPMEPPVQSPSPSSVGISNLVAEPDAPLRATFLSDNNIPDGQIFPPGAEFVKSWKMLNDGIRDWPETTQLKFVAGDELTTENHQGIVKIGRVPAGEEIDVWTGEMKAPEAPGKYVSYWRLNDGQGSHFGHSLWADITVAEPQKADASDEGSLASSSVIMPQSAPERSSVPSNAAAVQAAGTSVSTTDTLSDIGSDDSDMFIVDMPLSPSLSSGDSVAWADTREQVTPPETGVEYVVLYDDSSDDEQN